MKHTVERFFIPLALALVILFISGFGDYGRETFRYLGPSISHQGGGVFYRWVSGHLTHLGWSHTWLNLSGLASIWLVYGRLISHKLWLAFIIICTLGISAGLYFLSPEIKYYVGFSGVLHGMLALCATYGMVKPNLNNRLSVLTSVRWEDALVFCGLWGKIAYEQSLGAIPMTAAIAGDTVIINAHLYGACLGTAFAFFLLVKRRFIQEN